jgi:predicted S18 family serine protease
MSYWVGAYIEAGMGTSGSSSTPYLPFIFQAPNKASAEHNAGAKLLAGPFGTQSAAQDWVNSYERNPNTLHAGSGLNSSTGTVTGDTPSIPGVGNIDDLIDFIKQGGIWTRAAETVVGIVILYVGLKGIVTPKGQQVSQQTLKSTAKKAVKLIK